MKTNLSLSNPAEVETECLVAIVLDRAEKGRGDKDRPEKDKPQVSIETADAAVKDAAADVIAGGEVTGKPFETTLLHHPAKLKAKRLLLLGGGKAKTFSAFDLRRLAGAAVRTL
jgi:leucyl aminopeptidase